MKVLVLAPHPDDEAIGCGGMICHHSDGGDHLGAVFLTSGEKGLQHMPPEQAWATREAEARRSAKILGLAVQHFLRCKDWTMGQEISKAAVLLTPILDHFQPELVYLPHPKDDHPDHQATLPVFQAALAHCHFKPGLLRFYEVWTPLSKYTLVQDITALMPRKLRALRAHKSQLQDFDYVRAVKGLNQYRGALAAKTQFAEVFLESPIDGMTGL